MKILLAVVGLSLALLSTSANSWTLFKSGYLTKTNWRLCYSVKGDCRLPKYYKTKQQCLAKIPMYVARGKRKGHKPYVKVKCEMTDYYKDKLKERKKNNGHRVDNTTDFHWYNILSSVHLWDTSLTRKA